MSAVILAWLTYRFIEQPIRLRGKCGTSMLLSAMLLTGVLGFGVHAAQGITERYPKGANLLVDKHDFHWNDFVRNDICHLQNPHLLRHDDRCMEGGRPLVALWGDSLASALYPGLRKLQKSYSFGLIQLTQAGCAPIFQLRELVYRKNCNEVNAEVFERLGVARPDIVLLHAYWRSSNYPLSDADFAEKLSETIKVIKRRLPHARIVLLGPVPQWRSSPRKDMLTWRFRLRIDNLAELPERLPADKSYQLENTLASVAASLNVDYISIISEMCSVAGCLTRVGDAIDEFSAVDDLHLTRAASEYLMVRLVNRLGI